MKTTIYCILILFCSLCSCTVETLPDEVLTMKQEAYTGNQLRLNGFYKGLGVSQKIYFDYIFFYKNGTYFGFGYKDIDSINQIPNIVNYARESKQSWGLFQVVDSIVSIQRWTQGASTSQNIVTSFQYNIINDTTLYYKNAYGETTYHFVRYSPKPDNTNTFIK